MDLVPSFDKDTHIHTHHTPHTHTHTVWGDKRHSRNTHLKHFCHLCYCAETVCLSVLKLSAQDPEVHKHSPLFDLKGGVFTHTSIQGDKHKESFILNYAVKWVL